MHRFMRCAALALLATACVSTGTPTAPSSATTEPSFLRTPQHFTIRFPLEVTAVALCTGEQISLVGELREAVTLVSDETGALLHVTDNGTLDAVGTGSVTGAKYLFHDAHQSVFNTPNGAAVHFTQKINDAAENISQGSLDNLVFHLDIHLIVTGQGIEKLTVDHGTLECVG
jgi:hypothetical protein